MPRPLVKICGLTNLADAQAAIAAGADWLGFIFVPESPRSLTLEKAHSFLPEIKRSHPEIRLVGVFKDASPTEIVAHLQVLPLDAIQLHGDEEPRACANLSVPVIKVLQLKPNANFDELKQACEVYSQQPNVDALLLDLPKGSGLKSILDWPFFHRLPEIIDLFPCVVAGGLNPDNIAPFLSVLSPMGLDVASGVESGPGQKDIAKMQAFCCTIQQKEYDLENKGEQTSCNL